ncbi:MAG TPA: flavodoxin family protein [Acidobacteriota bacterium]|nr:flavodoxin family protein [Acidobacteriota bacterium]
MKKVIAFVGSGHKKLTHGAVRQFLNDLESFGDVETELVTLSDYRIGTCRGCRLCFDRGEENCPMKDDRDTLIGKIMASDGVVFASPNYSFQVSGMLKVFLDRLGFVFHRPRFFGKAFTSIVTQGFFGGKKIVSYLDFAGNALGFNVVPGVCFTALDPPTTREREKRDKALAAQSRRFHERMDRTPFPTPTLLKLWGFRMGRTNVRLELTETDSDYQYYTDRGWFDSDYFYPVRLNPLKKAAGRFFDVMQTRKTRKRKS